MAVSNALPEQFKVGGCLLMSFRTEGSRMAAPTVSARGRSCGEAAQLTINSHGRWVGPCSQRPASGTGFGGGGAVPRAATGASASRMAPATWNLHAAELRVRS